MPRNAPDKKRFLLLDVLKEVLKPLADDAPAAFRWKESGRMNGIVSRFSCFTGAT